MCPQKRKSGRKKQFDTVLKIRVTKNFKRKLDELAEQDGLKASEYTRQLLTGVMIMNDSRVKKTFEEHELMKTMEPLMRPVVDKLTKNFHETIQFKTMEKVGKDFKKQLEREIKSSAKSLE